MEWKLLSSMHTVWKPKAHIIHAKPFTCQLTLIPVLFRFFAKTLSSLNPANCMEAERDGGTFRQQSVAISQQSYSIRSSLLCKLAAFVFWSLFSVLGISSSEVLQLLRPGSQSLQCPEVSLHLPLAEEQGRVADVFVFTDIGMLGCRLAPSWRICP